MQCWRQGKHIDQWNREERGEINPHKQEQLIFDTDPQVTQLKIVFSMNDGGTLGIHMQKRKINFNS